MIQLKNVSKIYGTGATAIHAVNDVSLSVSSGEIFGIIGYSGAGKSTLIRLFNGLETVTSGEVRVGSSIISELSESQLQSARLKIGMIFQHFNLLWSRTVAQNIAFPLQIAGVPKSAITARVKELIGLVGLEGRENAYPSQLSGGQKQRVGIARALANEPELLLCDEATSALDPQTTDQILDLLLDINRKLNLTIVLITHEMQVARRICNHVAVMEAGKIVEHGDVVSLFTKPKKDVTKRFVRQISQEIDDVDPHSFDLVNGSGAIVHITYIGVDAAKPVLSEAIRDLGVNINILHGRVTNTASAIFGELYVHVPSDAAGTQNFLDYLQVRGVDAEIVKQGS